MGATSHAELSRLSALIELIYEGTTRLDAWEWSLASICDWLGARDAIIFTPFHAPDIGGFIVSHNMSPAMLELWGTKYLPYDIWAQRCMEKGLVTTGVVLRDQQIVTEQEFLSSVIYRELLAPAGIGRVLTGIVFGGSDNRGVAVACSCHRRFADPFTEEDAGKFELLLPHISRAMGVMSRLRDAEFRVATSLAALDRLPTAVLLFGADGAVSFANAAAHRALKGRDGLYLRPRWGKSDEVELRAETTSGQQALAQSVRDAISPGAGSIKHFSRAVVISRPSGKPPLLLHFSSLPRENEFGAGTAAPRAIAFLSNCDNKVRLSLDVMKSAYGLTQAECRVAQLIAEGCTNEELVDRLQITINTVKTQLRQIYSKTNTRNRARLVKLLMAFAISDPAS
jgi:DNA-binding CsgD family transcriptional regulator